MKIAYLTSVYARASDTFIRNEVIELRNRGHELYTFSIRRDAKDKDVSLEVASEQARTIYILEQSLPNLLLALFFAIFTTPIKFVAACQLAWKTHYPGIRGSLVQIAYLIEAAYLARQLKLQKIDILHNHIAENSANVAMLASLLSGVPYSMTVHGPGIFFHPREWALGEKIARSAFTATITSFCKSQCMLFSDQQYWHKLNIVRCSVGKSFSGIVLRPLPEAPRLLFVGRLCAEKGLPILIEAVARLIESGLQCELALIGDGPLRTEIEQTIINRKLGHAIQLLGWKSSEEVSDEIQQSRALVLPSFAEGLPVVIMEALALHRPVITSQIAGIPELVVNGESGWLVPAGSVEALVEAIKQATTADLEQLQRIGDNGAKKLEELHQFSQQIDKLENLLVAAANNLL